MPFPVPLPHSLDAGAWRLRAITDADRRLEQELSEDPDVVRWTFYPPSMDEQRCLERIARTRQRAAEHVGQRYVVSTGRADVGTAGIAIGPSGLPEVFYALLPRGRGRGAATTAAVALSEWALAIGMPEVVLFTIRGNAPSEAVATRAGFRSVGEEMHDHRGRPTPMLRWSRGQPTA